MDTAIMAAMREAAPKIQFTLSPFSDWHLAAITFGIGHCLGRFGAPFWEAHRVTPNVMVTPIHIVFVHSHGHMQQQAGGRISSFVGATGQATTAASTLQLEPKAKDADNQV